MSHVMRALASAALLCTLAYAAHAASMPVDLGHSTVTIHVFKTGLFSGFAHNHEIAAPLSSGSIDPAALTVELHFDARKLTVLDPDVSTADRAKIQETTLSDKVLDAARFPEISFTSRTVRPSGESTYSVDGDLTLHGATHPLTIAVALSSGHYRGSVKLKQSDFGIAPISVFGGSVKVKDVVEISFDIAPQGQ